MTMKALIVDDEPLAHDVILAYLEDVPFVEVAGRCHLATEALTFLSGKEVDLIFLDVDMPKLKGIDFLKILTKKPEVIITSAHGEYALEGFELDVCDYLLKPFRYGRFLKAVNKAHEQFLLRQKAAGVATVEPSPKETEPGTIFIKVDRKLRQVEVAGITCLEAYGNYVKVWVGQEVHLTPRTLSSFEKQLDAGDFTRIHKSYMVQKRHIDFIEDGVVHLNNGRALPLGKNFRHLARGDALG